MLDAICGDGEGVNPMVLAVIAIAIAVLMFGGCASGGCGDCCSRDAAAETAK